MNQSELTTLKNVYQGGRCFTAVRKSLKLNSYEKLFLHTLGAELDWSSDIFAVQRFISRERMALEMSVCVMTVDRTSKSLRENGYIKIVHRYGENGVQLPSFIVMESKVFDEYEASRIHVTTNCETKGRVSHSYPEGNSQLPELNSRELNSFKIHSPPPPEVVPVEKAAKKKEKPESHASTVWTAYKEAYLAKYGVEPIRNAKVNGQLSYIVKSVGREEAAAFVIYYVKSYTDPWVEKTSHSLDAALKLINTIMIRMKSGGFKEKLRYF